MNQTIQKEARDKRSPALRTFFYAVCAMLAVLCFVPSAHAGENPLDRMTDDVLSFFKPVHGVITKVEGKTGFVNIGGKDVRKGMRFTIVREEAPFRHPVTKELLGNMESFIGRLEIREAAADSAVGEIVEGDPREGDKIRISEIPVNILFCQSRGVEWQIADSYYRKLKDTGRFNIIDTAVETEDPAEVIREAKRLQADVALLLTAKKTDKGILTEAFYPTGRSLTRRIPLRCRGTDDVRRALSHCPNRPGPDRCSRRSKLHRLISTETANRTILSSGKQVAAYTYDAVSPSFGGTNGFRDDDHLWLDRLI
jgi:hypothetical protein